MLIKSLEDMEKIVRNNRSLSWDGWTVVDSEASHGAWMKINGAFKNGRWYAQKKFELTTEGWEIPNKFVR